MFECSSIPRRNLVALEVPSTRDNLAAEPPDAVDHRPAGRKDPAVNDRVARAMRESRRDSCRG